MSRIAALFLSSLVAISCSHKVQDIDPNDPESINLAFGFDDLKVIATNMTQSFLDSNAWGGDRPRIVFGGIQNRTTQHIDTINITDTIRTALIQSQKFTVLAGDQGIGEIDNELAYQQSGAVDLASAAELGKQLGSEYVFYGRFTEIRKQRSDTTATWYKFTMNAVNTQTRQIVWADEQDIAKKETKAFIGW
ncbi:MAG: penicillin-binding protein activator LpoB [Planctomycetes bacterium]|nr:penicillin-binding protein activator LpoB [Planctomycetota bacterium]